MRALELALAAWLTLAVGTAAARAPSSQLVRTESTTSFGTRFERYEQRVRGMPCWAATVS